MSGLVDVSGKARQGKAGQGRARQGKVRGGRYWVERS